MAYSYFDTGPGKFYHKAEPKNPAQRFDMISKKFNLTVGNSVDASVMIWENYISIVLSGENLHQGLTHNFSKYDEENDEFGLVKISDQDQKWFDKQLDEDYQKWLGKQSEKDSKN